MIASVFKAYDIRGKVGSELSEEFVEKVGRGFADWLPEEGEIAVGYDMRPESKQFAEAIIRGATRQGYDVVNIGQVATDMIYYAVGHHNLAGGVMVTASHNPGEYNGIKLCREKATGISLDSGLAEIRDLVLAEDFVDVTEPGQVRELDVMDGWIEHVLSFVDPAAIKPFKVAVDTANGMAGAVIPHLAKKLPIEVTEMYFELDGTFPNHEANPLKLETLADLQGKVTGEGLDLGIAFDADGDRMAMVDENGQVVNGTILTCILSKYLLGNQPGATMLYNVTMGRIAKETIKANGGKAIRTRNGHSFIKNAMAEHDAYFGGEHSMHFFFRDNWYADSGLIAAIVALAALSDSGKKLSELAAEYDVNFQIPETNFEVKDKQSMIDKLAVTFSDGEQDRLDGLSVDYENSWFNVRPSNTEPLLRLNAEANSQEELDALVARVKQAAGWS